MGFSCLIDIKIRVIDGVKFAQIRIFIPFDWHVRVNKLSLSSKNGIIVFKLLILRLISWVRSFGFITRFLVRIL